MFIWLSLRWWYSAGWQWAFHHAITERLRWCLETFSLGTLIKTLFAPFKQTYSGNVKGSLGDHFRAFVDRTISRVVGFFVRSFLIFAALISMLFVITSGLLLILLWAFIPLLPAFGLIFFAVGLGT